MAAGRRGAEEDGGRGWRRGRRGEVEASASRVSLVSRGSVFGRASAAAARRRRSRGEAAWGMDLLMFRMARWAGAVPFHVQKDGRTPGEKKAKSGKRKQLVSYVGKSSDFLFLCLIFSL